MRQGGYVDFDAKTVSVVVGIASSLVALGVKLFPKASDRLKRDLELLKLARESKANYLPIQRHVDAQINDHYMNARLGFRHKVETVFPMAFFGALVCTPLFGLIGLGIAYVARVASVGEPAASAIVTALAALGLFGGLAGGSSLAGRELEKEQREAEDRIRSQIEDDRNALIHERVSDAA